MRSEYITKYIKNNIRRFEIKLSKKTENDIIAHLQAQPNVNQYIKELIIKDIKKGG